MLCIGNQAGSGKFRVRWQRPDGVTETIPASALRARNRRDYYSFGGAVVAMREGVPSTAAIRPTTYLFGDHLGSSSLATNASGAVVAETRHRVYGEIRWASGAMPTDRLRWLAHGLQGARLLAGPGTLRQRGYGCAHNWLNWA